jgi:RNA-dependent RNA polymerase
MQLVSDFVVRYIDADILGLICSKHLLCADLSTEGVKSPDCIALAGLASKAVDFKKSGEAVGMHSLPRVDSRVKPDFMSGEQCDLANSDRFYKSHKALGQLFRAVELPRIRDDANETKSSRKIRRKRSLKKKANVSGTPTRPSLGCRDVLFSRLAEHDRFSNPISPEMRGFAEELLIRFSASLDNCARTNTLSWNGDSRLSEAELFVGSINASTSQYTRRRDLIAKLRTETKVIGEMISAELMGDEEEGGEVQDVLDRAWAVINVCVEKKADLFGASIIKMVAVNVVFDMFDELD